MVRPPTPGRGRAGWNTDWPNPSGNASGKMSRVERVDRVGGGAPPSATNGMQLRSGPNLTRRTALKSSRQVRQARKVLVGRSRRERRNSDVLVTAKVGRALRASPCTRGINKRICSRLTAFAKP